MIFIFCCQLQVDSTRARTTDRNSHVGCPKNFLAVEKIFFHTFIFLIRLLKDSFDHDLMTPWPPLYFFDPWHLGDGQISDIRFFSYKLCKFSVSSWVPIDSSQQMVYQNPCFFFSQIYTQTTAFLCILSAYDLFPGS